ncbi:MAG: hypothetical protein ACREQ5_19065, partial [Candidatus Dormibacteria bacterium]
SRPRVRLMVRFTHGVCRAMPHNEASPAVALRSKRENRVAVGDIPTAFNRLLRRERKRLLGPRIADLCLDRERRD